MNFLIRLSVLAAGAALISCGGSNNDSADEDNDNGPSGSSYSVSGIKTMAVEYSTDPDTTDDDAAPAVSGELPVEEQGFITMSASSTGEVIIAGAAHGKLYYSDDGGVSWYTLEGIGVQEYWTGASVSADGRDIAVSGQSFYVSRDSGETWTVYPYGDGYDSDTRLAMSGDGKTVVKTGNYVQEVDISHDYGETWTENFTTGEDNNLADFDLSADGQRVAALHYGEELKISDDGGLTWADTASGITGSISMDMSPDGMVIALLDSGGKYEYINEEGFVEGLPMFDVYLSLDGGGTWTIRAIVEGIQGAQEVSISDDGSKLLVSGINPDDPIMISEDYGVTWKEITTIEKEDPYWPHYTHVFSNSGNRIVAMEHEYSVWTSDDSGRTWIKRLQGHVK